MPISRRRALAPALVVAAALALTACTSSPEPDPAAPAPSDVASEGETRTIEHALGTTEVPVDPQRIVTGRRGTLPMLLDLGVEPVGAYDATAILGQPFHPLISDAAEAAGVEPVAVEDFQLQLEAVAALEPDLIVSASVDIEGIYDQLSEIAPTVALDFDFDDPVANAVPIGEVVGLGEEAAALVADFEAAVADAGAGIEDPGTLSIVGRFGPDDLRVYRSANLIGSLVEDLGGQVVPPPEELPLDPDDGTINLISEEQLSLLSGDRLVILANPQGAGAAEADALRELPIFQQLPAVEADRILQLDVQLPFFTAGFQGLELALEELVAFLQEGA